MNLNTYVLRLGVALLLGASIGLERQWRQRMAGTRTNALVSASASAFMMTALLAAHDTSGPSRVIGQIVSGIGFLGAGVIFKEGANIRGLNTAATIWASAAIGTLSGLGFLLHSFVTAVFVILSNVTLRPLAYKLHPMTQDLKPEDTCYNFELVCRAQDESRMRALLLQTISRLPVSLYSLQSETDDQSGRSSVNAGLRTAGRSDQCLEQLGGRLWLEDGVAAVSWRLSKP